MHYSPMPIISKQPNMVGEEMKCLYKCVRVCLITANKAFICTASLKQRITNQCVVNTQVRSLSVNPHLKT